ncbi:MAG: 3-oxoacyl-[acyl-carrier-protein] reductase [Deltaproteobacteria bacterium]|nr:3-oxoacyl-[acyl-carrier-protein] reductase [Deltaproteobacteria bacterium]
MSAFAGQRVLVTGSTRGIGRAVAAHFAAGGARVALTGRSQEAAASVAAALSGETLALALEVSDPASVSAAVDQVVRAWGGIDVLVNNAGITRDNLILRMKLEDWRAVLDANLTGAFLCCKECLRHMIRARAGVIINISSVVGEMGNPGQANYCASKSGLEGLTRSLAREYANRNIRVNAVAPGFIATDMTDALGEDAKDALLSQIPLGRLGTPEDVARVVGFLASEGATYVTGQVLHVNGGMYMA